MAPCVPCVIGWSLTEEEDSALSSLYCTSVRMSRTVDSVLNLRAATIASLTLSASRWYSARSDLGKFAKAAPASYDLYYELLPRYLRILTMCLLKNCCAVMRICIFDVSYALRVTISSAFSDLSSLASLLLLLSLLDECRRTDFG